MSSKSWINSQLSSSSDPLQDATQLLAQLQITISSLTLQLSTLTQESINNLSTTYPNIEYSLQATNALSTLIQNSSVQNTHSVAFQELFLLDQTRSRMQLTRDSLREAENWNSLNLEMDDILSCQDYEKAAVRLNEASRSLALLSAIPEFQQRKQVLIKYQNYLYDLLLPKLNSAFTERNHNESIKLREMFINIQKEAEFISAFEHVKAREALSTWAEYDSDSSIIIAASKVKALQESPFIDWISKFYLKISDLISQEISFVSIVFNDPKSVLVSLLNFIFTNLIPTFNSRLNLILENMGNGSFVNVIFAYKACVEFGIKIEELLSPMISVDHHHDHGVWGLSVFDPFLDFQLNYAAYERNHLLYLLSLEFNERKNESNYMDVVRVLPETVHKLINHGENAVSRCQTLTLGFATIGLLESLNDYFCGIVDRLSKILLHIRSETDVNQIETRESSHDDGIYERRSSAGEDDYEVQRHELGRQEWGNFQLGLFILNSAIILIEKVDYFENLVKTVLSSLESKIKQKSAILEQGECEASILSLRMSRLNSMELIQLCSRPDALSEKELNANPVQSHLLGQFLSQVTVFAEKAQRYLYDTMFITIDRKLRLLPMMNSWAGEPANASPFDLELPEFSLSPLEYVTRIGEHLLSLPQQLDLYMDDESLRFSMKTLPFMNDDETISTANMKNINGHDEESEKETDIDVTYIWLKSVCKGTMDSYYKNAMMIPKLSMHGCNQLLTDMQYLVNVFSAMDIEPLEKFNELMKGLKSVVMCEEGEDDTTKELKSKLIST